MSEKPTITFPTDYTLKIIGRASEHFDARVISIINTHLEKPFEGTLSNKDSKQKNYQSLTITLYITSKEQLEAICKDLRSDEDVMMLL